MIPDSPASVVAVVAASIARLTPAAAVSPLRLQCHSHRYTLQSNNFAFNSNTAVDAEYRRASGPLIVGEHSDFFLSGEQ